MVGPDNQDLAFGDLDEAQSIDLKKKNEQTETQHMYLQLCWNIATPTFCNSLASDTQNTHKVLIHYITQSTV